MTPRFLAKGVYNIEVQVHALHPVVPYPLAGVRYGGSATVMATVTSDGTFKTEHELTDFTGLIEHDRGYSRTVRFTMEQDGLLALTAVHDPMTVFEWGAIVTQVEAEPVKPAERRTQVLPLVLDDLAKRIEGGAKEYGEPLTTFNGRKPLQDAYEEVLDLALYLKQELLEQPPVPRERR